MPEGKSSWRTESNGPRRTLKIEADGDYLKGPVKPKIRLMGRWLERAGFNPGQNVLISFVAPGVIELRSAEALLVNDSKPAVTTLEIRITPP